MPHFLINSNNINGDLILLNEPQTISHLCFAMRVRVGENLKLIDENKISYFCKITEITKKELKAQILKSEKSRRILPFKLNLIQSVLKLEAQNLAISNAVQLGVAQIYPVISTHSTFKLNLAQSKLEKWQKIALEAFKQCERGDLPIICEPLQLKEALGKKKNIIIFGEKNVNSTLKKTLNNFENLEEINVVIGPEGGFSEDEFAYFKENNYPILSLGNLILKAPNAITAGLSNIIYELGHG